jgi:hypothetical protein
MSDAERSWTYPISTAEMLDLVTAEAFAKRPGPGYREELVQGKMIHEKVAEYLDAG